MQPDGPVARGRDLVAFEVQELVRRNVFGQDIAAVRLEHRGKDDAVEHDVVLADEVHHLRILRLPVLLPVGREVLRGGDIADRGVEPDVEHLSFGSLHGYGNTPVQVAAHGTRLQSAVEPALALPVNVRFPLLVALQNPLAEELLVTVQRQVPVLRLALHGNRSRHGAAGVDQLVGRERRTALLALVAVGAVVAASGTRTDDVTVGEERLRLLVIVLHRGPLDELALVVELPEKGRGGLGMGLRRGARIDVERHAQPLERPLDETVVTVHDLLRRDALLAGLDGDGHAVLVRSADRQHVAAPEPQVTGVDVRRYVNSRQVADMHGAVGIGERRSHEVAFELFCHR